jgi:glucokinase
VPIPVLEVGGSHVTAATVELATATLTAGRHRAALDPRADATTLLDSLAAAARHLDAAPNTAWGVAVPGPFDYAMGVARYQGVGKFAALNGVNVAKGLADRLHRGPSDFRFVNDASAFALGAWHHGPVAGAAHLVAITLGTGVGSAFLEAGTVIEDDTRVPPEGRADLLTIDGHPLEDTVSTRAMTARYTALTGTPVTGMQDVTSLATDGDPAAREVIDNAMTRLGTTLAPWLSAFTTDSIAFGGAITAAWPVVGPPLLTGLGTGFSTASITVATDTERIALVGAALHTIR